MATRPGATLHEFMSPQASSFQRGLHLSGLQILLQYNSLLLDSQHQTPLRFKQKRPPWEGKHEVPTGPQREPQSWALVTP